MEIKESSKIVIEEIRDRVRGVITGIAAGDRIGGPIRMAVRLSESLVTQNRFDIDRIRDCYFKWWTQGGFDTGPVTEKVFELAESGISFKEAVYRVDRELEGRTAGCNPVHRNPPIAMATFIGDKELSSAAIQETSLTHKHFCAGDVAAATLVLCRNLIRGVDWGKALRKAAEGRAFQTRQALQRKSKVSLKKGGFAPDVLTAAVYFVNNGKSFVEALNEAITFAGSANYCPVVVGAVGGAKWGAASIPRNALSHCDIFRRVQTVADLLAGQWQ